MLEDLGSPPDARRREVDDRGTAVVREHFQVVEYGRRVVEMLTPEQATAKLRKNEESWLVGRGQGVVRYDVVQSQ